MRRIFTRRPAAPGGMLREVACGELDRPGCPICRIVFERESVGLESILWEQVTDPATQRLIRAARGYCFEHTWALAHASDKVHSSYGTGIILLGLLRDLRREIDRHGRAGAHRWLRPARPCPACVQNAQVERDYARETALLYAENPFLAANAPATLCRPHLAAVLARLPAESRARIRSEVAARQRAAMAGGVWDRAVSTAVGRRPATLPEAATHCLACARARDALARAPHAACCRRHAWQLALDAPSALTPSELRVTTMAACPLCASARTTEAGDSDAATLCLGHLRLLLDRERTEAALPRVTEGLDTLVARLERFGASADYRFTATLTHDEGVSWKTAIARVGGETPGIDLHAWPPEAATPRERVRAWLGRLGRGARGDMGTT